MVKSGILFKDNTFNWMFCFLRTDMYLYAVDPVMNVIIDMDTLSQ